MRCSRSDMLPSPSRRTVALGPLAQASLALASLGLAVLVARRLGADAYGLFALITSLQMASTVVGELGMPTATLQLAARKGELHWLRFGAWFAVRGGLALALVMVLLASLLDLPEGGFALALLASFEIPLMVPFFHLITVAAVTDRPTSGPLLLMVWGAVRGLGGALVLLLTGDLAAVILAQAAVTLALLAAALGRLRILPEPPPMRLRSRLLRRGAAELARILPLQLLPGLGLFWLGFAGASPTTLGLFAASLTLAQLPKFLTVGTAPFLLADASRRTAHPQESLAWTALALLSGTAMLAANAEELLTFVYGPAFADPRGFAVSVILGAGLAPALIRLGSLVEAGRGPGPMSYRRPLEALFGYAAALPVASLWLGEGGVTVALWAPLVPALLAGHVVFRKAFADDPLRGAGSALLLAFLSAAAAWLLPLESWWLLAEGALLALVWLLAAAMLLGRVTFRSTANREPLRVGR